MSSSLDIFLDIKDGAQLEEAIIAHISAWLPVYLREIEIQRGWPDDKRLPNARSYTVFSRLDHFDEQQLPAVVVSSPGLAGAPKMEGTGAYTAIWNVNIAVIVSAMDQASTNTLAKIYAAAVRGIMVQKPSIGGFAVHSVWTNESYDDLGSSDGERTFAVGVGEFAVMVEDVVNKMGGPRTYQFIEPPDPETQPGSQWPNAQWVIVDVNAEGFITEPEPVQYGLNMKGEVHTVADLPTTGQHPGDAWLVLADGHLYVWEVR